MIFIWLEIWMELLFSWRATISNFLTFVSFDFCQPNYIGNMKKEEHNLCKSYTI